MTAKIIQFDRSKIKNTVKGSQLTECEIKSLNYYRKRAIFKRFLDKLNGLPDKEEDRRNIKEYALRQGIIL